MFQTIQKAMTTEFNNNSPLHSEDFNIDIPNFANPSINIKGNMKENLRIIISGGGTGGHIFPAVSIANAIK